MGLGPPVCQHCQVIAEYNTTDKYKSWYCPICGNTNCTDYTGFSPQRIQQCYDNRKLYEFFRGNVWPSPNGEK